jgi:hypothetical protein
MDVTLVHVLKRKKKAVISSRTASLAMINTNYLLFAYPLQNVISNHIIDTLY